MASYEVTETRYVDLPNKIGLNANGKVVMVDEKTNYEAHIGDELSRYEGMLNDEYGISIVVEVVGDGEYEVTAYRKRNGCTTTIFDEDEIYDEDVLDALGRACQVIESDYKCTYKCCDHSKNKCEERSTTSDFLRRLRKMIDAALDD